MNKLKISTSISISIGTLLLYLGCTDFSLFKTEIKTIASASEFFVGYLVLLVILMLMVKSVAGSR
jgi:hypothetical protein